MPLSTVLLDIAPVYEHPALDSARIDEVLYGTSVQILQESEKGWCYLRTEHHTEGYAPLGCLERDADIAAAWRKYKKVTVLAPYVDVQKKPEPEAARLVSVPRGGLLVALGQPDEYGWQKVGLAGGAVGYTRASYVGDVIDDWTILGAADLRWNIVETALSYNGTAFRVGGRSPMGIDEIGLVVMSYHINGVSIPRSMFFEPGGALHEIKPSRMGEGDVIFFENSLGICMGDNHFVHATDMPGSEGVVVSSLKSRDEDYRPDLAGSIVTVASLF